MNFKQSPDPLHEFQPKEQQVYIPEVEPNPSKLRVVVTTFLLGLSNSSGASC